jgi:hypothetical protein
LKRSDLGRPLRFPEARSTTAILEAIAIKSEKGRNTI